MNVYHALWYWSNCRPSELCHIRCGWPEISALPEFSPGPHSINDSMAKWLDIDHIIKNQPLRIKRLVFMFVRGKVTRLPMPVLRHLQRQFEALD